MKATELTSEGRRFGLALAAFALTAGLAAADVASDLGEGAAALHLVLEGGVFFVGLVGAVAMGQQLRLSLRRARELEAEARVLADQLKASEADAARWRSEAAEILKGLGAALDRQFERWALSPAEKEVALLLLKGLSHKEIAEVRTITEATARQQARAVYKKAGLAGRNDLAAFFLEDLLLPGGGTTGRSE